MSLGSSGLARSHPTTFTPRDAAHSAAARFIPAHRRKPGLGVAARPGPEEQNVSPLYPDARRPLCRFEHLRSDRLVGPLGRDVQAHGGADELLQWDRLDGTRRRDEMEG